MQSRSVNLEALSDKTADTLIDPLTTQLRLIARESGWPARLIQGLTVTVDDTHTLYVDYPDELREDIENMEYGDINGLPNAAIRPFIFRAPKLVEEIIREQTLQDLFIQAGVI